jgi:hypothetical protein
MAFATIKLIPGVNTQKTLAANQAGVSVSNLIRYRDQLVQKIGGWNQYYSGTIGSTIRCIWGWQGLTGAGYLAVGATAELDAITAGSATTITPQTLTFNIPPDISISSASSFVTIVASGSSASIYDTVYFNTPVAIGNLLFNGAYPVAVAVDSSSFQIVSSVQASTTIASSGTLPTFTTIANSATVTVALDNHNFQAIQGLYQQFIAPTSVGGLTIQGPYQVNSVLSSTSFTIAATLAASAAQTATMNSSLEQLVLYKAQGPPPSGGGYGLGGYGLGGYGLGSPVSGGTGTPITTTDWTLANWGEALLACPKDGPIYVWSPRSGFQTASVIATAPFFNGGIFVAMPQQILVAYRSVLASGVQDPLTVRWSDQNDYTNWTVSNQTAAGDFRIPTGSKIIGAIQGPSQAFIWTDVGCWVMQYVGGTVIFNFTEVGSGCGLIGPHAANKIANIVYWCSNAMQFFRAAGQGVEPLPCPVWDAIFQNLSSTYQDRILCWPNSVANEIWWFYPSTASTGENDSYVKYNVVEGEWDYGPLARNAGIDVTGLGMPIATDTVTIYQHEVGFNNVTQPLNSYFESGYWSIAEGNDYAFVDWFLPDMKFGTYSGSKNASVNITFKVVDYLGDTPRSYGPFTFTSTTQYLSPRFRGRFMSVHIESNDTDTFWRIGAARYRFAVAGRR